MLNKTARLAIESELSDGYFRAEDFSISAEGNEKTTLIITYNYKKQHRLVADLNKTERVYEAKPLNIVGSLLGVRANDDRYLIEGTMVPGEVTESAPFSAKTLTGLLGAIETWLRCIKQESAAEPRWRSLNAWRESVDEKLADLLSEKMEAGPLSSEEQQSFKTRLDELEAGWKEQLEQAVQDQAELKRRVDELHKTVEFLKDQVSQLDRPSMRQALLTRLYVWLSKEDNQKLLKTGSDVAVILVDAAKRLTA